MRGTAEWTTSRRTETATNESAAIAHALDMRLETDGAALSGRSDAVSEMGSERNAFGGLSALSDCRKSHISAGECACAGGTERILLMLHTDPRPMAAFRSLRWTTPSLLTRLSHRRIDATDALETSAGAFISTAVALQTHARTHAVAISRRREGGGSGPRRTIVLNLDHRQRDGVARTGVVHPTPRRARCPSASDARSERERNAIRRA